MSKKLSTQEAITEAKRCLNCLKPACSKGCPIENNIPHFIRFLAEGNIGSAYEVIAEKSNLPAVCGRVCPHEKQCEAHCILAKKNKAINIGSLEMFIADFAENNNLSPLPASNGSRGKIAVVGSGPAGLTIAADMAKMDFAVTIYEAQAEPGGVLLFGIPQFRLDKNVVRREIQKTQKLGVDIKTNCVIGTDVTIDELFTKGYDAVFIGSGTALPKTLNLPGKDLHGIITATYFLKTVTLANNGYLDKSEIVMKENDQIIVIGAGNVAMDAARTAIRQGARSVKVVYHKTQAEMTALNVEYQGAVEDGIEFCFLNSPLAFEGSDKVTGLLVEKISKNEAGEFINTGEKEIIPADVVILAVGQKPANRIVSTCPQIEIDKWGFVITRERPYGMTTYPGVFAGGDVVHGPATVVLAMKDAKKIALGMSQYVDAKKLLAEC